MGKKDESAKTKKGEKKKKKLGQNNWRERNYETGGVEVVGIDGCDPMKIGTFIKWGCVILLVGIVLGLVGYMLVKVVSKKVNTHEENI